MKRLAPPRRASAVKVIGPQQWILVPTLLALVATWVFALPVRAFGLALPEPVFPLVLAMAWPLIRPSILAPGALFLTGFALDLFCGSPLGLWPLCLLAAYGVILFCRPLVIGQDTRVLFGWYAGISVLAFSIAFMTITLMFDRPPHLMSIVLQWLPTILLFPAVNWMLDRFDAGEVRFR